MRYQMIEASVVVMQLTGDVLVVDKQGVTHQVQPGERLSVGSMLILEGEAKVVLEPDVSSSVALEPAISEQPTPIPGESTPLGGVSPIGSQGTNDIAAIQEAILQGVDPTLNFEATAAGGAPAAGGGGAAGSGNGGFVSIDRTGANTLAAAGFDTNYSSGGETAAADPVGLAVENNPPVALNDTVSTPEDTPVTISVLVNDSDPDSDPIAIIGNLSAEHGVVTVNPDGTLLYQPDANYNGSDSISYTITDPSGLTSSAIVNITVTAVDDPIIIDEPIQELPAFSEADLPLGSASNKGPLSFDGSFTVQALAGLVSIGVGEQQLSLEVLRGIATEPSEPSAIFTTVQGNQLQITGFDEASGTVSYRFTLMNNLAHLGLNGERLQDELQMAVTDGEGDTANVAFSIPVVDDVPQAMADSNSVSEDGDELTVSGNVLVNDLHGNGQPGADVPVSFVEWIEPVAQFGSFTDLGNGQYQYSLNNQLAVVQGLDEGQSLTEQFSYRITDADGDPGKATLTITIAGSNDIPRLNVEPGNEGGNDQVLEAGLSQGSAAGDGSTLAYGSFSLSDQDGLADVKTVTINSQTVAVSALVGLEVVGAHGTLTVTDYDATTGVASYRYELTSPTTDVASTNETDLFTLSVSDGTSNSDPASITIEIVDDVPQAMADSNSVTEDGDELTVSGNVLVNDLHANGQPGADVPVSFVEWIEPVAQFGSFTDLGNGQYEYSLNNELAAVQGLDEGQSLTEQFSYRMQDADGDPGTATLTITIAGSNDIPRLNVEPGNEGGNDQVLEAGLPQGSAAGDGSTLAYGSFSLSDQDGLADVKSVTINGQTVAVSALVGLEVVGAHGTLTVTDYDVSTGVASYRYALTGPTTDAAGVEREQFVLSVSDGTASSGPAFITIDILDDVPQAMADSNSVSEDGDELTVSGNVLVNDLHGNGQPGADVPVSFVEWIEPVAQYGSFTDLGNGQYEYSLNNDLAVVQGLDEGQSLTEQFSYRITDADGDPGTATLTITINGSNDKPTIEVHGDGLLVSEAGLPEGSGVATDAQATGTFSVGDSDGLDDIKSLTLGGTLLSVGVGQTVADLVGSVVDTPYGRLTLESFDEASGTFGYSYQLLRNVDNDSQPGADTNGFTEVIGLSISDGSSTTEASFGVYIADDMPMATDNENSLDEDTPSVSGNVLTDEADDVLGGDGAAVTPMDTDDDFGHLVMDSTGAYTYTLKADNTVLQRLDDGEDLVREFTYTLTDKDGDVSTATLTITINGADDALDAVDDSDSFGEDAVQATVSGSVNVLSNDTEPDTTDKPLQVSDTGAQSLYLLNSDGTLSSTVVGSITFAAGGSYSFTLDPAYKAQANALDSDETLKVGVEYTAINQDGATDTAVLRLTINGADDALDAVDDSDSFGEDAVQATVSGSVNVLSNDTELDTTDRPLQVSDTGTQSLYLLNSDGTLSSTVVGSITFAAGGSYSFTLDPAYKAQANALDSDETLKVGVEYTAINQDGATDTAVLRLTINGADDALDAVDDSDSFGEDAVQATVSGSVNVLSNDTELDTTDKPLQVSDTGAQSLYLLNADGTLSSTVVGSITFAAGGSYSFTLDPAYKAQANALDSDETLKVGVEYTAINQDGATDTAVLRLTINGADDALDAVDDSDSFGEDAVQATVSGSVNVLSNDTELDTTDRPLQVSDTGAQSLYLLNSDGTLSSTVVGSITFAAGGSYSFTLDPAYKVQANALDSDETLKVGVEYTAINQDGATDTAVLRLTITGSNDDPEITISSSGHTVYEAGLPSGTNAVSNSESASGQFTVGDTDGLDDIKSITIGVTTLTVGAGGLAALVNSTVDTGYGSLRLTGYSSGTFNYTYTLTDPVDNDSVSGADTNGFTETISLSVSDGSSSASGSIPVTIIDDSPVNIQPMSAVVANSGTASGSGALDLFGHIGADKLGSVVFVGTDGSLLTGVFEGAIRNITSKGENITLTGFGTHTLVGTSASGDVVMTIKLNPDADLQSADRYTIEFSQPLDDGSKLAFDDFSTAPAGQNYWIGLDADGNAIGVDNNDSTDLLITAAGGATKVNTSSSDLGADNQHIDGGEGIRLDLVIDVNRAAGKDEKDSGGFVYDAHYSTHDFSFKLIQTFQAPCVVQLAAYSFDDTGNKSNLVAGSTAVAILASSIEVLDASGNALVLGTDYQVYEDAGKVFLTNMNVGYTVSFVGQDMFEAVVITNADGMPIPGAIPPAEFEGGAFDIGGFSYDASEAGSNIDLSFDLQVKDADGDTSSGQLDMTVMPNGNVLLGDSSANLLVGDSREERLEGAGGADTLIGGQDNDILIGGDGNDLFVWKIGDADGSTDRVTDFKLGVDQLDFADVLDGLVTTDNLGNYLQVAPLGSDTLINVYTNGIAGLTPDLIVVLEGCSSEIQHLDDLLTNNGVIY